MMNEYYNFILTHGRPNEQLTLKYLKSKGAKNVYLICDSEDETLKDYINIYGDKVIVFDKKEIAKTLDTGTNDENLKHVVYAREFCFRYAEENKIEYFFAFDDDISNFEYRYKKDNQLKTYSFKDFVKVQELYINYMQSVKSLYSLGFAFSGLFIGGVNAECFKRTKRAVFGAGLYKTSRRLRYLSTGYEDLITSVLNNKVGRMMLMLPFIQHNAIVKGRNKGGLHDAYKKMFLFKMLTLIFIPEVFKIVVDKEINHIATNKYFPMIIKEEYKK